MCLTVVKLMVLDRFLHFIVSKSGGLPRLWVLACRFTMAAVITGNFIGLCGNIAAAVYWIQLSSLASDAAAAFTANNTATGDALNQQLLLKDQSANRAESVQVPPCPLLFLPLPQGKYRAL